MSYSAEVGVGSASSKKKSTWGCGSGLAFGLDSRERAAFVKACAVLGGVDARSIRTVARRSSTRALAMKESTMRLTWLRERESGERLNASEEGAGAGMMMNMESKQRGGWIERGDNEAMGGEKWKVLYRGLHRRIGR